MTTNLYANLPENNTDEIIERLVQTESIRIERIISSGQASPPDFWYDQDEQEYVVLLQGAARLEFEHETVDLKPGDAIYLAAHQRHRVAWTSPQEKTIWLAIFFN